MTARCITFSVGESSIIVWSHDCLKLSPPAGHLMVWRGGFAQVSLRAAYEGWYQGRVRVHRQEALFDLCASLIRELDESVTDLRKVLGTGCTPL